MTQLIVHGILIGFGATLAMDLWAVAQWSIWRTPLPHWGMPGRWFAHLFRGRVFHDDISQSDPVAGETLIGWGFHYGVGLVYGLIFLMLAGAAWIERPSFISAWVFALITISAGWFLLLPGMGLGFAASKMVNPWKTRALGLVAHTFFGLGMWVTALVLI